MLYLVNEARQAMLAPLRLVTEATKLACTNPFLPLAYLPNGSAIAAGCEMFERATRNYAKPEFSLGVPERVVWQKPFCRVIAFGKPSKKLAARPKLLIVAPMSGHYATLLRGTVSAFLDTHQVFITDWEDARDIPLTEGHFDLDSYIDYCIAMFEALGPDLHVAAVCQPSVPVLAAIARMEEDELQGLPLSATLIGGPIDTRQAPTAVSKVALERGIDWFSRHCIHTVPPGYAGAGRAVYPGFLQLLGFMSMNPERHAGSHWEMFEHLVRGDGDSAQKHREFYDEYLAVMDLSAEFYLQTVEQVFIAHALPKGELLHHGRKVDLAAIRRCALMAIEGERDDITGIGQTRAALDLAVNLPKSRKRYHLQKGAGHYGVFNGARFRAEIVPRMAAFMERSQLASKMAKSLSPQEGLAPGPDAIRLVDDRSPSHRRPDTAAPAPLRPEVRKRSRAATDLREKRLRQQASRSPGA